MKSLVASALACAGSILCGGLLLAAFGPQLPPWLMALVLSLCSGMALACGFGMYNPKIPAWLRHRPVLGAICVTLGVGAMFVPASFVVSCFLLGCGTRLVWLSACELEGIEEVSRARHEPISRPGDPRLEHPDSEPMRLGHSGRLARRGAD